MTDFAAREYHRFEAAGKPFVYLVPSAAVFALDDVGDAILSAVTERPHSRDELSDTFGGNFGIDRVLGTLDALVSVRAIGEARQARSARAESVSAEAVPVDDDGSQRDEPVQSGVHVLLRVQRRQDRRHREREEAEVHDR